MIAVITILLAFPAGFFMRSWLAANLTYAIAYLFALVYQTLYLLLDALGGGKDPAFLPGEFPTSYGVVTVVIFSVGFGLVALGHRLAARRDAKVPVTA